MGVQFIDGFQGAHKEIMIVSANCWKVFLQGGPPEIDQIKVTVSHNARMGLFGLLALVLNKMSPLIERWL